MEHDHDVSSGALSGKYVLEGNRVTLFGGEWMQPNLSRSTVVRDVSVSESHSSTEFLSM